MKAPQTETIATNTSPEPEIALLRVYTPYCFLKEKFFKECIKGPFHIHKSWVGDRTFGVVHNTVQSNYIVNILNICALFISIISKL